MTFRTDTPKGSRIVVGKLWATNGKLSFEGDAEESAKTFFNAVIRESLKTFKEK